MLSQERSSDHFPILLETLGLPEQDKTKSAGEGRSQGKGSVHERIIYYHLLAWHQDNSTVRGAAEAYLLKDLALVNQPREARTRNDAQAFNLKKKVGTTGTSTA